MSRIRDVCLHAAIRLEPDDFDFSSAGIRHSRKKIPEGMQRTAWKSVMPNLLPNSATDLNHFSSA